MAIKQEYFTIKLSAEIDLGVPLADMTTAVQFETKNICAVPGVAEFWYGVVNYQGGLLWVLDSDRFLNGANAPASRRDFEANASVSLHEQGSKSRLATLGSSASCGETPKTALHRFFERNSDGELSQKSTAIIVRNQFAGDRKRVAIVTPQLKGIIAVETSELKSLKDSRTSRLHKCCSAVVQTAAQAIYLIDSTALLQEIHRQSLVLI